MAPRRRRRNTAVVKPNLGLYLDRPPIEIPTRGLADGMNFRIKNGKLTNVNVGWTKFLAVKLNGPVILTETFIKRDATETLILGTLKDLYKYNPSPKTTSFITPIEAAGTVSITQGTKIVTRSAGSADWSTTLKAGDEMNFVSATQVDPTATWYVIDTVDSNTQVTLVIDFVETTVSGGVYTGRKLFTGDIFNVWNTDVFFDAAPALGDLWFATNKVDSVITWDGTAAQAISRALGGLRCGTLKSFKNMMVYGDIIVSGTAKPTSVRVSDISQPLEVVNGTAVELVVSRTSEPIIATLELGDNLVIYTRRGPIILAQFVGDPLVFIFRTAVSAKGPVSGRAIADFGNSHQYLAKETSFNFNGAAIQETGFQVWREVLRQHDPKRDSMTFAHFDDENAELLWVVPLTTDPDTIDGAPQIVYSQHHLEDVGRRTPVTSSSPEFPSPYARRELAALSMGEFARQVTMTWDEMVGTWKQQTRRWNDQFFQKEFPMLLAGVESGDVLELNSSNSQDGVAVESFVRFGRRALSDGQGKGILKRVYPFAEQVPGANYDLKVLVWEADQAAAPLSLAGQFSYGLEQLETPKFVFNTAGLILPTNKLTSTRVISVETGEDLNKSDCTSVAHGISSPPPTLPFIQLIDGPQSGEIRQVTTRATSSIFQVTPAWSAEQTIAATWIDITNQSPLLTEVVQGRFVSPFVIARFVQIEFATTGIDSVWTIHGFDTLAAIAGER